MIVIKATTRDEFKQHKHNYQLAKNKFKKRKNKVILKNKEKHLPGENGLQNEPIGLYIVLGLLGIIMLIFMIVV
ncbi:hypothetical protein NX779_02985 [Mycoplasma cottewii]|uniref:Uncharacterized protein n=1 Tax=Mycoplasma cottewii TaxID=51364 RepID=A0ABY5TW31_9MOLU|nr:hypothetical protein [Mycoplasma cottewii]UWD34755.1 hypothetical protein NX779_02985 [Mycoplasma cottewii]